VEEFDNYLGRRNKGKSRQINMIRPNNLLKTLVLNAKIKDIKARILINSGCLGNFMSPNFVKKARLHIQAKGYQYTLYKIDD
jgi:hypothetical protein